MNEFQPVLPNPDLSIREDPPSFRVAVACRWKDAHRRRAQWPDVSMVGPLRTTRGIDLLVRDLLANPQIRTVIIDGADLTPGEATTRALRELWENRIRPPGFGDDITDDDIVLVTEFVCLMGKVGGFHNVTRGGFDANRDRPGGRIVLPPPAPKADTVAEHGDPGERIVGDTLSEVWPQALQRILSFGVDAPTKYGPTKEVLNLVSVFRDPVALLEEVTEETAPWLGFTAFDAADYAKRVTTPWAPGGAPYSYGTRIGAEGFESVRRLLSERSDDRGIGVSPWHPTDARGGKGRPCLVWAQFRELSGVLHLQFVFRSHDYFAAYGMNIAALSFWLVGEAEFASLDVGIITCVSVSAHLYDRDWNDAGAIVETRFPKGHQWDRRSTWRVEVVKPERSFSVPGSGVTVTESVGESVVTEKGVTRIRATALTPDGVGVIEVFEGRTAESIQGKIERSGLLTTTGNSLWLGRQLALAETRLY